MFFNKKNNSHKDKLDTYNIGIYGFWNNIRMSQSAIKNITTKCFWWVGLPIFVFMMLFTWSNYPIESQSFRLNTQAWMDYSLRLGNPNVIVYKYSNDEKPMYDEYHHHITFKSTITEIGFNPAVKFRAAKFRSMIYYNIVFSLLFTILASIFINYLMYRKGFKDTQSDVIDGVLFDPDPKNINKALRDIGLESDLSIGGLSLVKHRETYHTKVVGNTGTGKTILISKLISQIRNIHNKIRLMDRIVVLDVDSVFCDKYYDEKTDVILNPFDSRSSYYNIFRDIKTSYDADNIAEILVPDVKSGDPFWHTGPRTLIAALFKTIITDDSQEKTYTNLLDKALKIKLSKLEEFIKDTPAANLIDGDVKKTALSLRAILLTQMKCFEPLLELEKSNNTKEFSFSQWIDEITSNVQNPTKQIFLTYKNDQLSSLRPLLTLWISLMNSKITSLPRSRTRRIWLFIDELANLGELNDLDHTLRMARNYGLCCVAGYQNESDIEEIYGRVKTSSILALFSTAFYFRPGEDDSTADKVSKNLGSQEIRKVQGSKQYGVTDFRDGGSISEIEKTRRIVSPDTLRNLADRQAFVILPTEVPRTRIRLYYPGEKLDMIKLKYSRWYYFGTGIIFKFFARLLLSKEDKTVEKPQEAISENYIVESSLTSYQTKIDALSSSSSTQESSINFFEDDNHSSDAEKEVLPKEKHTKDKPASKQNKSKETNFDKNKINQKDGKNKSKDIIDKSHQTNEKILKQKEHVDASNRSQEKMLDDDRFGL